MSMSKPAARRATFLPIVPRPTMPSVLPASSYVRVVAKSPTRHLPCVTLMWCQAIFLYTARMSMRVCSATATELEPPLLAMGTPAFFAAATSILSYPALISCTSLSSEPALKKLGSSCSVTTISKPSGIIARAVSMMGSGNFGAKTILVGTGLSFDPGSRLGLRLEQHVGGASDGDELARAVADASLAEGDGAAAAQEPSLGDQIAVARRGEEADVHIEGGLSDAAAGVVVGRAQRAADGHVHERAEDTAVDGGAGRVPEPVLHGHPEAHPALARIVHEHAEIAPKEIVLGALAGDGQQVGWHGGSVIPKSGAGLNRER